MSKIRKTAEIRQFILENLSDKRLTQLVADKFGISRAAVYQNINYLVGQGIISHNNARKGRKYTLSEQTYDYSYEINSGLSESAVWMTDIRQHMPTKDNVRRIWEYGFTEMFNNAIDHSEGTKINVVIVVDALKTQLYIIDNGIGIFRKLKNKFNLLNEHEAILELSKGKLTTDRTHHTGECIFFTSRAFDLFFIVSHGIAFTHNDKSKNYTDVLFDNLNYDNTGTIVYMALNNDSARNLSDVFNMFSGDNYGFDKTVIPINLARYGDDNLVSRSQAKRVLDRVQLFKHVVFDFAGVPQIGQAFADEIFRVFHNANPNIELGYINANENVVNMIKRAQVSNI